MNGAAEFSSFIESLGFAPPLRLEPGRFARFATSDKRADQAGYAKLFPDMQGGIVGDFRSGEVWTWQAQHTKDFSEAERRAWRERIERERREAEALQQQEEQRAAQRAREIWEKAQPASGDHPYLTRKGVRPHGLRLYRGPLAINAMRCDGALILPLRNAGGELRSLEFIGPDGEKRFLPGGNCKGCYFAIGQPGNKLAICEGFATGATIHETTGLPVRIAAMAGNLEEVMRAIRAKSADVRLIICADNDRFTVCQKHKQAGAQDPLSPFTNRPEWCRCNPGVTAALEAARSVGGFVAVPAVEIGTDFNDLAAEGGDVKAQIEAAKPPPIHGASVAPSTDIASSAAADGWPEPQPLPNQLPPVMPFSFHLLPEELREWVADVAQRIQCPPEFPAVTAIVALGSVIGRKLAVRPKERDDWEEFPNLWGVIIGKPGVLKTPALQEAMRPLRALEAKSLEAHDAEVAAWRAGQETAKIRRDAARAKARQAASKGNDFDAAGLVTPEDEQEPQPRRYIVNDSSIEALGLVLQASPDGVLAYRDELIGLLKSLDREGMEGARAFYLSAYSGKEPHVYDRIGRGLNIRVEHCCVSMLGSIQPSVMGRYLREAFDNGGDDGLLSRFSLLVWPDVTGEWRDVDRWPDSGSRKAANALFERMEGLDPAQIGAELEEGRAPFLRFHDAARACFVEWREAFERKQRDGDEHPALVAHFAKYRKLVPALALIFHLASRGAGPITERALLRALGWAELLETHARRAYASIQQARTETARALLAKIRTGAVPNPIRQRDVYLKGWSGLSEPEDVRRAIELLEDLDYLRSEIQQTPGRSKTVYWINPRARA